MEKINKQELENPSFLNATGEVPFRLVNDYLFRAVLQENQEALEHLVAALLEIDHSEIKSCVITNPIILGESFDDKTIIMDVRILLNNNSLLNIEMQVGDLEIWANRALYYLCKLYCNLGRGKNYEDVLPSMHIGILPKSPFPEIQEFYSEYLLTNRKNKHIFTRNFSLRMLCLDQIDSVPEDFRATDLYYWTRLFVATTWEEIQMLAEKSSVIKNTASTMYQLTAEEKIKLQCEARERYEHDIASYIKVGEKRGRKEGEKFGRQEGEKIGRREGEKIGRREGEERTTALLNQLNQQLIADNRITELQKSTINPELQRKLLLEYHLIDETDVPKQDDTEDAGTREPEKQEN